VAAVMAVC